MTQGERAALVERLREDDTDPKMLKQAADQIEADGQRIAELEMKLECANEAIREQLDIRAALEAALTEGNFDG